MAHAWLTQIQNDGLIANYYCHRAVEPKRRSTRKIREEEKEEEEGDDDDHEEDEDYAEEAESEEGSAMEASGSEESEGEVRSGTMFTALQILPILPCERVPALLDSHLPQGL